MMMGFGGWRKSKLYVEEIIYHGVGTSQHVIQRRQLNVGDGARAKSSVKLDHGNVVVRTFAYTTTIESQTSWSSTYTQVALHTSASFQSSSTPPHALFHNSATMPDSTRALLSHPNLGGPSVLTPSY
jgi:hypothetical protein